MKKLSLEFAKNWYQKNKNLIKISVVSGVLITFLFGAYTKSYADNIQKEIAGQVVRFHVLANSDSEFDQDLKIKVKDGILAKYAVGLNSSGSIEETKAYIKENLDGIEETAKEIIVDSGYSYAVTVSLSNDKFPTKQYGDVLLPAGYYDALRIEIGEAEGKNWWCVMFPPLCFVDVTKNEAPEEMKAELRKNLTEEEYKLITSASDGQVEVKVKFKIVELWQELKER